MKYTRSILGITLMSAMVSLAIAQEPTPAVQATPAAPAVAPAPASPAKPAKRARTPRPAATPRVWSYEFPGGSRSYLGVDIEDVNHENVTELKLKEERGVVVTMVDQDAPAGKAGVKSKDVILSFNGERVEGEEQLRRMIRETPAGRKITLGISRDGQPMDVSVQLADRYKNFEKFKMNKFEMPDVHVEVPDMAPIVIPDVDMSRIEVLNLRSVTTGILAENLTPQLGEYFGVKGGSGLLVRSVEKGSAAEAAGVKAGDVIVKAGDDRIESRTDWRRALRGKNGKLNIVVVREKRELPLTITLPQSRRSDDDSKVWFDDDTQNALADAEDQLIELGPKLEIAMSQVGPKLQVELAAAQKVRGAAIKLRSKEMQQRMKELEKQLEKLHDLQEMDF
jgi:serine protease Do